MRWTEISFLGWAITEESRDPAERLPAMKDHGGPAWDEKSRSLNLPAVLHNAVDFGGQGEAK